MRIEATEGMDRCGYTWWWSSGSLRERGWEGGVHVFRIYSDASYFTYFIHTDCFWTLGEVDRRRTTVLTFTLNTQTHFFNKAHFWTKGWEIHCIALFTASFFFRAHMTPIISDDAQAAVGFFTPSCTASTLKLAVAAPSGTEPRVMVWYCVDRDPRSTIWTVICGVGLYTRTRRLWVVGSIISTNSKESSSQHVEGYATGWSIYLLITALIPYQVQTSGGSYSPGDNSKNIPHTGRGPSQGPSHTSTDRTGVIKALRPCYDYSSTHTTFPNNDKINS